MPENTLGLTYERVISAGNSLHSKERAELKKYLLCEGGTTPSGG